MKNAGLSPVSYRFYRNHSNLFSGLLLVSWLCSGVALCQESSATSDNGSAEVEISSTLEFVANIDRRIEAVWSDYGLSPSKEEEDGKWCRRVYLDLIGRLPTYEELEEFLTTRGRTRRQELVEKLLGDVYVEQYATHWSTLWTNILIGRAGGTENNSLTNREGMQKYLRDHFARNLPYDKMVYELVTATGATKAGEEGFNGATNFLVMKVNAEDAVQATAAVSKTFLGLQVQCTQCHNHPFNQWKQQKFWELNAFFRQTRALRRFEDGTRNIAYAELVNQDFAGESRRVDEADIYYQLRNGLTKVAYPVFVDGREIPRSGFVSQVNRRDELGRMVLDSEFLDKTIVNRMWSHFLGYGFTTPIDDLGPHNPPSHPELLEELATQFRAVNYDMKELIRWIVLSKPYQLSSKATKSNANDDPLLGESPKFSRFYSRQMTPEQLYESLVTITNANRRGSLEDQQRQRQRWLRQFVVAYGTDDGGETTTFNGSIPQTLVMFNGELIQAATKFESGTWLDELAREEKNAEKIVNRLFLATLARKPTRNEKRAAQQMFSLHRQKPERAVQDLCWAILNSNEFIINH